MGSVRSRHHHQHQHDQHCGVTHYHHTRNSTKLPEIYGQVDQGPLGSSVASPRYRPRARGANHLVSCYPYTSPKSAFVVCCVEPILPEAKFS